MGACNDCGASVADVTDLAEHAKDKHDGMPRIRFWDGKKETMLSPDGKLKLEFVPVGSPESRTMVYREVRE